MKELASCPNVVCKISGVTTEADHQNWTREQLSPYIAHAIETFGFDRSIYGGDWHVPSSPAPIPTGSTSSTGSPPARARRKGASSSATTPSGSIASTDARRGAEAQRLQYRRGARARPRPLAAPVFDFADGGAEDEVTLAPQRGGLRRDRVPAAPSERRGQPRPLGHTFRQAPGAAGDHRPDRSRRPVLARWRTRAARAAAAAGTAYCLSHGSVCTLEELAATGAAPRWMQVFIFRDRGFTRELAERAAAANFDALVLTTDNQFLGNRERDIRNGFQIPPRLKAAELAGMALKARLALATCGAKWRRITFGNYVRPGEKADIKTLAGRMASLLDPAMSWRDVDELRRIWKGPLILKGILHPGEAKAAIDHGIDGLVVSNHGGRQLDGAPASIDALPAVVEAVRGRIPVLLDGGIRRGADVVKALALGADACLIGRPHLWGLAVAGEAGVAHVLDIYRREIDRVMGLSASPRLPISGRICSFAGRESVGSAKAASGTPPSSRRSLYASTACARR